MLGKERVCLQEGCLARSMFAYRRDAEEGACLGRREILTKDHVCLQERC